MDSMAATTDATSAERSGATAELATCAVTASFEPAARALATRAIIDTVGVMVAGTTHPDAVPVQRLFGSSAPRGTATALGLAETTSAAAAAFVNGTLAHVLDYDDVSHAVKGHPSAVLVPTVLALAETTNASGLQVLDAYLAGFQVAVGIASGLDIGAHYRRGWHATSTVGTLGGTAAACRLLGLDIETTRHALGMSASFAAGTRQNFGSTTKSLHVGRAAEAAVLAALLASEGATADPSQFEGKFGFLALFGDGSPADMDAITSAIAGESAVLRPAGLNVKKYPCCYNAHRAADAAIATIPEHHGVTIEAVDVCVETGGSTSLIHHRPHTGLEAKFCGEYIIAAALLDGVLPMRTFSDEAVPRSEVQALLQRVTIREADTPPIGEPEWKHGYAVVEVRLADGRVLRERVDIPRGDARKPVSDEVLRAKFFDCLDHAGIAAAATPTLALIDGLASDGPASEVLGLLNDVLRSAKGANEA